MSFKFDKGKEVKMGNYPVGALNPKWKSIKRICIECGNSFFAQPCTIKIGNGKLCSAKCRVSYVARKMEKPGSIYKDKLGYVYILMRGHTGATFGNRYVKRALLVAEKKLNRTLVKGEITHHKNGIKDDDSPENIEVMSRKEHNRLHGKLIKGINTKIDTQCIHCGKVFKAYSSANRKFCSHSCVAKHLKPRLGKGKHATL